MSEADDRPVFDQVNLVVRDMDAALRFYAQLGLDVPAGTGGEWPPGSGARHADVTMPGGMRLEFDNPEMAAIWHAGHRDAAADPSGTARAVLNFSVPSRVAVDQRYAQLVDAGYTGRQPPYDAFWGARYAIVADPDGNDVGLMSPIDSDRKYVPEV
jgi:catechol 2,3-dioxygenase-like lactoylglutathione lyase family enzyme